VSAIRSDLLSKVRLSRRLQAVALTERARQSTQQIVQSGIQRASGPPERRGPTSTAAPERIICVGASTGGPTSILTLLLALDATLPIS
ncbi:hypothetical protein NL529_29825, partial [Klebsiella pneumoniae]|nr:hypothetical protein [Klebsiella pneumoniae]